MAILITEKTRVIVQGMSGRIGQFHAEDMIKQLVDGQEAVTRTARGIFPLLDKVSDEPTADLLTQRMQVHEKTAWMLRALLS